MSRPLTPCTAVVAVFLTCQPAHAEEPAADPEPAEWGVDGPYAIDVHARIGGGGRLDAPPLYETDDVGGLLLGLGLGVSLSKRISVGAAYEHLDFGSERSGVLTSGVVNINRELHSLWLDLKAYPVRIDTFGLYVAVAAGLSLQDATLTASLWVPETPGTNVSFFCNGSVDPGFAFQGSVGFDVILGDGLRLFADTGIASHRLSDEVLGSCVPGAGTATVLTGRAGVGYAWDL